MRKLTRLWGALLACCLAVEPAGAAIRGVRVQAAPATPAGTAAGAAEAQSLALPRLSLPSLTLGSPALPDVGNASVLPSLPAAVVSGQAGVKAGALALPAPKVQAAPSATPVQTGVAGEVGESKKKIFQKKLNALKQRFQAKDGEEKVGESFEQLFEESLQSWENGKRGPAGAVGAAGELLAGETPRFTPGQLRRVRNASKALEAAVTGVVAELLPKEDIKAVSRGSSARMTQADMNPDHDIMVKMPSDWSLTELDSFMRRHLPDIRAKLEKTIERETAPLFQGEKLHVSAGSYIQLSDPVTRRPDAGVYMLPVKVFGAGDKLLLDVDVTFASQEKYTNDYPGYFAAQLEQVARLGGEAAVDNVLSSIRLAKRMFEEVVGAYKVWRGGPSGVGVEQMIMQSGRVEAADKGRTVLEPGDFDKFMDRVYGISFAADGRFRGAKQARRRWEVHNPFREPENFLTHLSEKAWQRLANAARNYRLAQASGRPISFAELGYDAASPAAAKKTAPAQEVLPARDAASVALRFTSSQKRVRVNKLLRDMARTELGAPVLDFTLSSRRENKAETYRLTLTLESGASSEELAKEVRERLTARDSSVRFAEKSAAGLDEAPHLLLFVDSFGGAHDPRTAAAVQKTARRLARRLNGQAKVQAGERPGPGGEFLVKVSLESPAAAEEIAALARSFFKTSANGVRLSGVAFPGGKKPAAEKTGEDAPGRRTVEMLEKFTTDGPKPAGRGEAFLYAQGAKALPAGLESSWAKRRAGASGSGKGTIERTLLRRRGGKAFILVPTIRGDGSQGYRPASVPAELVEGVVTDTLVEAELSGPRIESVTPIGSYAMDMMIGRVVKRGGGWALESLFRDESGPWALYGRLPLFGEEGLKEGEIVQAFIKPASGGFAAEAMLRLGTEISPEIAAREIALRHGARGYFDEAVIRQAEAAGEQRAVPERFEDMTGLPFVTVDPIGAGDLDDAYYVEKHADGSYTWYLATADVAQYVPPGSPAFRAAARIGNTFYSIDKDGVPEYPMNHPVVSKYAASLLAGKDSPAMITRMRFGPDGKFIAKDSDIHLGKVRVRGRYTYEQVVELWRGGKEHGIAHAEQVALARELASKLDKSDADRGKLALRFRQVAHKRRAGGEWGSELVEEDPLLAESHKLIEELKVYGNRAIAALLERITAEYDVPHISRVHPRQEEAINKRLRKEINKLGLQWGKGDTLWDFLKGLQAREDLSPEGREVSQLLALMTRRAAQYATVDAEGHEGLALEAGQYDHPSTPIRRFADMYNRTILEAYLEGGDPRAVYKDILADITEMGFRGLDEYMIHLNGRESASKLMDREVDDFMSVYELAKPEHRGRKYRAYVKVLREGRNALAVLQFSDLPVSITLRGEEAGNLKLLDEVEITIRGADPARFKVDASVRKTGHIQAIRR